MPKILRIINRLNLGGPTFNAAYLTRYLAPEYETLLVAGVKDESEASSEFILDELGIKPVIIPEMKRSINPVNDCIAYQKINKIIKDFKPEIVHSHAAKAGALGRYAAYRNNVPVILHTFHGHVFHSYFGSLKTNVFLNIEKYLAKRSSGIIAISEQQKFELANQFKIAPEEKIKIIPLGFDLQKFTEDQERKRAEFRERFLIEDDEVVISIIGRIVPVKNHLLFLKAVKRLENQTKKRIRAFIVGDGETRGLTELHANELNIEFSVGKGKPKLLTFTSWIKEIDMVMAGSEIIALTSLNEGTPVSLIEAQASAKAVVSTDVGGVRDVLSEDNKQFLTDPNDHYKFAENLQILAESETLRNEVGKKSRDQVLNKYNYIRLINDMNVYYRSLLP